MRRTDRPDMRIKGHFFPLRIIPNGWESEVGTMQAVVNGVSTEETERGITVIIANAAFAQTREHAGAARLANYLVGADAPRQGLAIDLPSAFDHRQAVLLASSSNPESPPLVAKECSDYIKGEENEPLLDSSNILSRVSEGIVVALRHLLVVRYESPYVRMNSPLEVSASRHFDGDWVVSSR